MSRRETSSLVAWLNALLWIALALIGLMAGFFYAYSVSVMVGLREVSDSTFIETMQWINATVRNMWFGPAYFGSLLISAIAVIVAFAAGARKIAGWMLIAFVLYAIAFFITILFSIPLNNDLRDAGDIAQIADPAAVRADYEDVWSRWNNIRTVVSTGSLVAVGGAMRAFCKSSER